MKSQRNTVYIWAAVWLPISISVGFLMMDGTLLAQGAYTAVMFLGGVGLAFLALRMVNSQ